MIKNKLYFHNLIAIFTIALSLLIYSITNAQELKKLELKGRITDEKKKPIYRAHIQLIRDGKIKNRTFTDWKGNYQIWPIGPGGYQALVSLDGYDRIVQNIDIKPVDTVRIDFTLHKKGGLLSK
jgi:hypothetical protein